MANDRKGSKPPNGDGSPSDSRPRNRRPDGYQRLVEPVAFSLDRRDFVKLAGLSVPFASLLEGCALDSADVSSAESAIHIEGDVSFDFSLNAVRKEDFVFLRFDFLNFAPDRNRRNLVRQRRGEPSLIVVNFQPQHLVEEAFFEQKDTPTRPGDPVVAPPVLPEDGVAIRSRIGGPSRLAFVVPGRVREIPLSLSGLLRLVRELELHVALNALPPNEREATMVVQNAWAPNPKRYGPSRGFRGSHTAHFMRMHRRAYADRYWRDHTPPPPPEVITEPAGAPKAPSNHETAIELPFRLLMSPNKFGGWAHASQPVSSRSGRVELWHTRLGTRTMDGFIDERDPTLRKARAIWTRDPDFLNIDFAAAPDDPNSLASFAERLAVFNFEALTGTERAQIVQLTSNFEKFDGDPLPGLPRPVDVNQMMLTGMGGWLDVRGDWPEAETGFALEQWEHRATLGRDHFVKVVKKGFLYPYGHRASVVKVTERKFKFIPGGDDNHEHTALLRSRLFIIVREPQKDYEVGREDTADAHGQNLRKLPFETIQIKTLVTPNLDLENLQAANDENQFIPTVGGEPFRFRLEALDIEGNLLKFAAPVVFVPLFPDPTPGAPQGVPSPGRITSARDLYDAIDEADRRLVLSGQRLAFAPSAKPDDAVFETDAMLIEGYVLEDPAVPDPDTYPGFFPVIARADITLQAVRQVSGNDTPPQPFTYHEHYVENGFPEDPSGSNQGEILFRTAAASANRVSFNDSSDRSGALVTPNFRVVGLSRRIGPVSANSPADIDIIDPLNPPAVLTGEFDPAQFFGDLQVFLFGVINLVDILKATGVDLDKAPKYITEVVTGALGALSDLERLYDDLSDIPEYEPFDAENLLGSDGLIQTLLTHVRQVLEADPAADIDQIQGDVDAILEALPNVPAHLQALFESAATTEARAISRALRDTLTARANALIASLPAGLPQLLEQLANLALAAEFPKELRTRMQWRGQIQPFGEPGFFEFTPKREDALLLSVDIKAQTEGAPELNLACAIEDFDLSLFADALTLKFDQIVFKVENGKKPDVVVDFNGIEFGGALAFVNRLRELIPLDGFSDPPNLSVDASGIRAGFNVGLPNISIGIFSIENISLGAELKIPFIGDPLSFSFNFCTRENPFNLTVALLGGGGFFGCTVTPKGFTVLEASLEAGARISINLFVASGSVSAMLGIYFRLEVKDGQDEVSLTGYFKIQGKLDVLGLISATVTLTLSLTYNFHTGKLHGEATVVVEIDILFFSASVEVKCERNFAGSSGDPTFREIMAPEPGYRPWDTYLAAFAA